MKTWRNNRARYEADLQNPLYGHIRFVRITRRGQGKTLIADLKSYS